MPRHSRPARTNGAGTRTVLARPAVAGSAAVAAVIAVVGYAVHTDVGTTARDSARPTATAIPVTSPGARPVGSGTRPATTTPTPTTPPSTPTPTSPTTAVPSTTATTSQVQVGSGAPPPARGAYVERASGRIAQAVVVVQNGSTPATRSALAATESWRQQYFETMAAWFAAVSGGRYGFVPAGGGVFTVMADAATQAATSAGTCASDDAERQAMAVLDARHVAYESLVVVFDTVGCRWAGRGTLGTRRGGGTYWAGPVPNTHVDAHELGHNLGFVHALWRRCPGGLMSSCTQSGVGYGPTPLGVAAPDVGYNAPERLAAGFIDRRAYLATAGNGVVQLVPAFASSTIPGVRIVEVFASASTHYVFEYRTPGPVLDRSLAAIAGVRAYRVAVSGGVPNYRDAELIRMAAPDESGQLPVGTVVRDGRLAVAIGSGGRITISGL